jgi:hypothetical protein
VPDDHLEEDGTVATTDIQGHSERVEALTGKVDALRRFL